MTHPFSLPCIGKQTIVRTHGRTDARTHGRTDARTHGRTDARTHGRTFQVLANRCFRSALLLLLLLATMQATATNLFTLPPYFYCQMADANHEIGIMETEPYNCGYNADYTTLNADCSFLITSAVELQGGGYQVCVQANDPNPNQTWNITMYPTPTITQTGSGPVVCWTFPAGNPSFNITHSIDGMNCTMYIFILDEGEFCPANAVTASVENCHFEATLDIDLDGIGNPFFSYVITFDDGSPAEQSSSGQVNHTFPGAGTYEVCLSYYVPGYEIGFVTCCYDVEIPGCPCPQDVVHITSVEPCTWITTISIDLPGSNFPITVDFGDGTSEVVNGSPISHDYSDNQCYNICYTYEPYPGDPITCCELECLPECCLDASFTVEPDWENGWQSCYNPEYVITPTGCLNSVLELTHVWEFPDGEVFYGAFPPNQIFTNFWHTQAEICITHTVYCCDESVSETVCVEHFPGAYLGEFGGEIEFSDILPFTGQNVLTFLQQNANGPVPLLIDGLLTADIDGAFNGGVWNMGRESEILVQGTSAAPRRAFELIGTTIRSAVRLDLPLFAGCCRWKGIRSQRLTLIRLVPATIMDANYAIHYPSLSAGSPFPLIYSVGSSFVNNFYGIKSVGQHVLFSKFHANTFNGAPEDPHICGCTAVNAIDFQNVNSSTLNVTIDPGSFGNNEIFNYERGLNFRNTRLIARGLNIHNLREYATSPGVPNNPVGESAIGIDFFWSLSSNSLLELNRASFTNFEELGTLSYAVRDRIVRGRHTLRAAASALGSINTAGIAGGYDLNITSPGRLEVGSIISLNTIQTDGSNSAGEGFGITGNFTAANNSLDIRGNQITVSTNGADPMNGGIVLTSTEDLTQPFSIEHNTIDLALTNGVGIGITGARGYCVRRNLMSNFSDATGIELSGGGDAVVECNEVLFKPTGVHVISSDENTYSGNFLSGNVNDMHFNGDNRGVTGSLIQWNEFNFSWQSSLVYDAGAFTGAQHLNNTNYNSWTGQGNQGGGNVEVQHANTDPNSFGVTQSRFRRPSNALLGSVHFPNHSPGMMINSGSITITSAPSTFCNSTSGCFAMLTPPDPDPEVDYAAIVQDAATWSTLTAAQQTSLRQGIYGHLLDNPAWLNGSSALSNFKSAQDATFIGQSETLRKAWLQLMADIAAHQATLEPTYDSLNVLGNQLQQWFDVIATDPSLEASLQGDINAAIQQGEALQAQLQQAEDQFAPTVQATVAQLLAQNAALDGSTPYGWNEKRYNEIALNWLAGTEPNGTAASDLRTIAQNCLADGGRAVLDARGLCAVWLKEYYDEGNCGSLQPRSEEGAATVTAATDPVLRIVPNPANDVVSVSLNVPMAEGESLQVQFLNLNGQKVYTSTLYAENEELTVPVRGWLNGVYVAKTVRGNVTFSQTFIVQHR
ncbi:MAG: T9SS type A sorting domain-containing protein [Saprospiraceae bacterium]|nr:T9SS type A sorting domain-containing protein [Saprospiraceae bacterium]MCF8250887.1 T9SS type A sorting domain-containing protein [Saprospiraceae bacterium]MCF8281143.1 T9SS type A sorting domain-containing protein [Bacteroidales bacterium]MCF8312712.1 T9SS type A sorting domain-containing protein [Saprospiraceae bacterium]MCF8441159.1 T9SS type A sorting domain-containing protein [Saprospiraceae bacterium]